ncbi:MAG TPA: lysophospholipid acyltransferase family protein [Thermoleophilaceae bacterium]|nr:lysophospholipid acyltransferase family protein [Thermoleophilaceae bacterium]
MKAQVYKDPRPAEYFTPFHERVRRGHQGWMYEFVRSMVTPYLLIFHRTRCIDSDRIPAQGSVIIAPNHFSFLDHFFSAIYTRRRVQFMAKSQLFKPPMQFIFSHGGVFPIRRGHRDEEGFISAKAILGRGGTVVMYAEGGRSRTEDLSEQAKPGIGRLALESGAAVVPTAIYGSQKARNWKRLQFPKVTVQYGTPLRFERVDNPSREQSQAAADIIFERIRETYDGLAESGRARAVRASRAARRAAAAAQRSAEAAGRRPVVR